MSVETAILPLVRPAVLALKPYSSARSLGATGILLDANESPWTLDDDPSFAGMNRYPMPQPPSLMQQASRYYGVGVDRILVSRGSDEGIDLLVRAVCEAGKDRILICPPTYGVYEVAARIQGCDVSAAPLKNPGFELDERAVLKQMSARKSVKLVFVCSPNNPTGGTVDPEVLTRLCRKLQGSALVVLDEAYQEFATTSSMISRLAQLPNLVILRTLSKAWGLAGARCGFALAHPALISILQRIRAPYPMSCAAVKVVESVFDKAGESKMRASVKKIISERKRLEKALRSIPRVESVFPSEANFLLAKVKDSDAVMKAAKEAGIVLRDRGGELGLTGCIRISIGTPEQNDLVIAVLRAP